MIISIAYVWMRDTASKTAHLHRVYSGGLLAGGATFVSECGHQRSRRAFPSEMRIALCEKCLRHEARARREAVAA